MIGMADGFAQVTGCPALVKRPHWARHWQQHGALLTAAQNKAPIIVTAGQQAREMVLMESFLTDLEATMLPPALGKMALRAVAGPEDVPVAFIRAIATACSHPQTPSFFLSLPVHDWDAPFAALMEARTVSRRIAPDRAR